MKLIWQNCDRKLTGLQIRTKSSVETQSNTSDALMTVREGYGKNVYRVDGTELLVNDLVSKQLDEIIGLTPMQAKVVKNASGEAGVRDFRNYLATAGSMMKPVSVTLIANPSSRTVSGLVSISEDPITSDAFFDFLELFLEKNSLYPVDYQMAYDISAGFTLFLNSNNPDVRQIAPNEDFLVNSY